MVSGHSYSSVRLLVSVRTRMTICLTHLSSFLLCEGLVGNGELCTPRQSPHLRPWWWGFRHASNGASPTIVSALPVELLDPPSTLHCEPLGSARLQLFRSPKVFLFSGTRCNYSRKGQLHGQNRTAHDVKDLCLHSILGG